MRESKGLWRPFRAAEFIKEKESWCFLGWRVIEVMTHASQRNLLGSKFVKYVRCSTAKHLLDKFFGPLNFILWFIKKFSFQERHACFYWLSMGSWVIFSMFVFQGSAANTTSFMKSNFLSPSLQVSTILPIRHKYNPFLACLLHPCSHLLIPSITQ